MHFVNRLASTVLFAFMLGHGGALYADATGTDLKVVLRGGPNQARVEVTDANDDDNGRVDPNGDVNLNNRRLPGNEVNILQLDIRFCDRPGGFMGICMTTTVQGGDSFEALAADPSQIGLDVSGKLNITGYNQAQLELSGSAKGAANTNVTQIEWFASVDAKRIQDQNRPANKDRIRFDQFGPLAANTSRPFSDSILDRNNAGGGPASIVGVFDLDFGNSNNPKQTLRLPSSAFAGVIAIPEPSTVTLLTIGLIGLFGCCRRPNGWRRY